MQIKVFGFLSILTGASILCFLSVFDLREALQTSGFESFLLPAVLGGTVGGFVFKRWEKNRLSRERRRHLNSVLRSIRNINQIVILEKDAEALVQKVCDTLVDNRDYYSVWIGLMDAQGQWWKFAEAGLGECFEPLVAAMTGEGSIACCKKAMAHEDVVVTEAPTSFCGDCPLTAGYENRGALSARLAYDGKIYGMITVSVPRATLRDPEEIQLVSELSTDIAFGLHALEVDRQRKDGERVLSESLHNLKERMKELHCLYSISEILGKRENTIPHIMKRAVELIPPALQYPEASCASVTLEDNCYRTLEHRDTDWKLERDIVANDQTIGRLTVGYMGEKIDFSGNPFIVEEEALVKAIAERLGKTVERLQAQMSLRESEQRFRILVENSLTGISIVQGNEVVYQNREQERLLGSLPRAYIMGEYDKVHPDDVPKVKRLSRDIMNGNITSLDVDFRYSPAKDMDKPIWIHCRANRVVYRNQASILFNMMDMTRTKELEKLLVAQDKMASLGRVAAGIAHEIRNPLSGINIYLNTLEKFFDRGENQEKVKGVFQHLQSASRKIESVIRRVMDFSKPSSPHFVLADINVPVEEALRLTATTVRKSGIQLEKSLAKDLPRCRVDPHQFEEVVLNIVGNAADSLRGVSGEKRIKIATEARGDLIAVRILDSGPGIAVEHREKIFDPFFTTKSDSTGIGLSICHRIISDHGGDMAVRTNDWGGTEFTILIPAVPAGD